MTDYLLTGHKCNPIARLKMGENRDWWLGELTEPIEGFPNETHCLHIKTPLKEVVLGVNRGDMEQLAVLCQIVCGSINPTWIEHMETIFRKRAGGITQRAADECERHAANESLGFKFCPDCGNPLTRR